MKKSTKTLLMVLAGAAVVGGGGWAIYAASQKKTVAALPPPPPKDGPGAKTPGGTDLKGGGLIAALSPEGIPDVVRPTSGTLTFAQALAAAAKGYGPIDPNATGHL